MEVDAEKRVVRLSARELAAFRTAPTSHHPGFNQWRAGVGQQWHKTSEEQTRAIEVDARFEVPITTSFLVKNWTFHVSGRIDQLVSRGTNVLVREVKTVRTPLPSNRLSLLEKYPDYFAQASVYQSMLNASEDYRECVIDTELQFINIENGAVQCIPLETEDEELFDQQTSKLLPFLESRRHSLQRLRNFQYQPAFETLRDGQQEIFARLAEAALNSKIVLHQAPTGFGKTGIILEHALSQMQQGMYDRCIYLSSKTTGQLETVRQLQRMIGRDLRFVQMHNRLDHAIDSPLHSCVGGNDCADQGARSDLQSEINPDALFIDGTFTLKQAKTLGEKTGACPYLLTKACLPFAEFWIGDLNYIFAPESRPVFTEALSLAPDRTLLIVDEAHNLPERAADALSAEVSSADLIFAIEELREHGAPRKLISVGQELCRWIDSLPFEQPLDANEFYLGQDLCEDFSEQLKSSYFDFSSAAPFAIHTVWQIPKLVATFSQDSAEFLYWSPRGGVFTATCLEASHWIQSCLAPFGSTILMSATMEPFSPMKKACGLTDKQISIAIGQAQWRENAYDVAIDCRVDTQLKHRDRHYETTARTALDLSHQSPGVPVVVFFPSYRYADNVLAYLEAIAPHLRAQRQPKGGDLTSRLGFINEALLSTDIIFLILGSSFAEAIDQLGGQIDYLLIVGPALPEANLIQRQKIERHSSLSRQSAFRDVYIRPAMRRIHQALGRIVRAPGQRARVLLHCRRFLQEAYFEELLPEYQSKRTIDNNDELQAWLIEPPFNLKKESGGSS